MTLAPEEMHLRRKRIIAATLLIALLAACGGGEEEIGESEPFSFVIYPGSRYLGQLTEATKQAHRLIAPEQEPPPTAIYDTEAPLDEVAAHYAKQYGYDLSAAAAPGKEQKVMQRTGELATDVKAIEPLLRQMNMPTDVSKASGTYKAIELAPKPNRPRVTIQRPYFDVTTSEVVDRTMILMSR